MIRRNGPAVNAGTHRDRKSPKRPNSLSRFTQRRPQGFRDMRSVHNFRDTILRVLHFYATSRQRNMYNKTMLIDVLLLIYYTFVRRDIYRLWLKRTYVYVVKIVTLLKKNLNFPIIVRLAYREVTNYTLLRELTSVIKSRRIPHKPIFSFYENWGREGESKEGVVDRSCAIARLSRKNVISSHIYICTKHVVTNTADVYIVMWSIVYDV